MDNKRERENNYRWKKGKKPNSSAKQGKVYSEQGDTKSKFPQGALTTGKFNDVSWYAKNSQILADAASFSYNQPVGSEIPYEKLFWINDEPSGSDPDVEISAVISKCATSIPGVMNLYVGILPGVSLQYQSPLNLAAQNIYSYVRYMNSGAKNYDPQDLMLYLMSLDSAYACWNFFKRIYGLVRSYSQSNWYSPRTLVETAGVDFQSVKDNLADFRMYLNVVAAKLMSFCTPATMPIFIRHSWIFSNVWADASNPKAQLYQFSPMYFYQYQETTNPQGGQLKPIPFCTFSDINAQYPSHQNVSQMNVSQMKSYLDGLITSLSLSEDIGVMSGDILKAYGQSKLFKLSPVVEDYIVTPTYNEEVLNQIHNSTIVASHYKASDIDSCVITQNVDAGTLVCNPVFQGDRMEFHSVLVNTQKTTVTPADTMVNTRLTATWVDSVAGATPTKHFTACGTEFVYMAGMTFIDYTDTTRKPFVYTFKSHPLFQSVHVPTGTTATGATLSKTLDNVTGSAVELQEMQTLLSQFDWAPLVLPVIETVKFSAANTVISREYRFVGIMGDVSNWTIIPDNNLANLHLTAVMSEFDIPQIGSF